MSLKEGNCRTKPQQSTLIPFSISFSFFIFLSFFFFFSLIGLMIHHFDTDFTTVSHWPQSTRLQSPGVYRVVDARGGQSRTRSSSLSRATRYFPPFPFFFFLLPFSPYKFFFFTPFPPTSISVLRNWQQHTVGNDTRNHRQAEDVII